MSERIWENVGIFAWLFCAVWLFRANVSYKSKCDMMKVSTCNWRFGKKTTRVYAFVIENRERMIENIKRGNWERIYRVFQESSVSSIKISLFKHCEKLKQFCEL